MKKIKLTAFVFFFGAVSYLNAQENRIELTIGAATPLGNFGDTDFDNDEAGFAESGANLSLSYEHRFANNIGAKFLFNYQSHSLDNDAILEGFQDELELAGTYSVSTSGFKLNNLMGGVTGTLPFGESKFSLTGQLLIGISFVVSSDLNVEYSDGPVFIDIEQEEGVAAGISAFFGGRINYDFNESFGMNIGFDSYATSLKFEDVQTNSSSTFGNESETTDYDQSINTFNTNLGFYFRF